MKRLRFRLRGQWVRAGVLTVIGILAITNLLTVWLYEMPQLPFEWTFQRNGAIVYDVTTHDWEMDVPRGAIWISANEFEPRSPESIQKWLKNLKPGQRVEFIFFADNQFIRVPWKVRGISRFIYTWLWGTGLILFLLAVFIHNRYGMNRYYRRLWYVTLSLSLIYFFSPSGRWNALDHVFWLMDGIGFALAPPALIHWSLAWHGARYHTLWNRFRRFWPFFWILVHMVLPVSALTGIWNPWTESYRTVFHTLLSADWLLLAFALLSTMTSGLFAIPRLQGMARERMQIITASFFLAYAPAILLATPYLLSGNASTLVSLSILPQFLLPLGIALTLTRTRFDTSLIFKRGLTNIALWTSGLVLYGGLFGFIEWAFARSPSAQVILMALLATAGSFLLSENLRKWVLQFIHRYYYSARSYPREELESLLWKETKMLPIEPWLDKIMNLLEKALEADVCAVAVYVHNRAMYTRKMKHHPTLMSLFTSFESPKPDISSRLPQAKMRQIRPGIFRFQVHQTTMYALECELNPELRCLVALLWKTHDYWMSQDDISLLTKLQNRITVALENLQLYLEAQHRADSLEHMQKFQHIILQSLDAGLLVTDVEHRRCLLANENFAQWFGRAANDLLMKPVDDFLPRSFITSLRQFFDSREEEASSTDLMKTFFTFPNGRQRLLLITRRSISVPIGESVEKGCLYLMEDITRQHELEQQLIQAEKLSSMGLLAAGIAHEINTPLTGIASYAQMLVEKLQENSSARMARRIHELAEQTKNIIQTLLDMAQPQRQTFHVLKLQDVVQRTLKLLKPHFRSYPIRIETHMPKRPLTVLANEALIQQVITNLLMNARDALPNGGKINIRLRQKQTFACIEVIDNGIGMDEHTMTRIFDPFFTTKSTSGGTGLGLTITYHIVKQHNGQIEVQSRPGKGTVFRIELPLFVQEKAAYDHGKVAAHRR